MYTTHSAAQTFHGGAATVAVEVSVVMDNERGWYKLA
jgi:hypothetical protein